MTEAHDQFMQLALAEAGAAEAEGNIPVGSLIVQNGAVIGVGRNRARSDSDPTAHAEVDAIRDACRKLGTTDLSGATCYPCGL